MATALDAAAMPLRRGRARVPEASGIDVRADFCKMWEATAAAAKRDILPEEASRNTPALHAGDGDEVNTAAR